MTPIALQLAATHDHWFQEPSSTTGAGGSSGGSIFRDNTKSLAMAWKDIFAIAVAHLLGSPIVDAWPNSPADLMRLIFSRISPFIDSQSLEARNGKEALFRKEDGSFLLYLSTGDGMQNAEDRLVHLDARNALIWVNEQPGSRGSFRD